MSHFRDETIVCVRCGEPFTWSYGEQAYFRQHGLHRPKHCQHCQPIRREQFRAGRTEPFPYVAPQYDDLIEPVETAVSPPPSQPTNQPNWWDKPINRYNLLLFILVLLAIIVFWFILQAV